MASHVRGNLRAATLVLASGPGTSWSSVPSWSPLSNIPLPGSASRHLLAPDGPPGLLGTPYSPPSLEVPRGDYGFSEAPRGALSLVVTQGKGCAWQKQLYKYGRGEGPPESLRQLADDTDQGCILVLEPLVVSPEVRQGLRAGMGQLGFLGRPNPLPTFTPCPQRPLLLTFSSSSSSAAFRSRALRSWDKWGKVRARAWDPGGPEIQDSRRGWERSGARLDQWGPLHLDPRGPLRLGTHPSPPQLPLLTNLSSSRRAGLSAKRSCL